ncbi:MAG TPA: cell division topological specificity factor MinE [Clostridiales bacterium]|nr:cell division topological specificity factor MinE [Clostridiales bacterium]
MVFWKRLFAKNTSTHSKNTAKKRLQLVLVQDRLNIGSETLEGLKNDLIAVIGKHLEIDVEAMDVSFRRDGEQVAIVANIPVLQGSKEAV